MGFDKQTIQLFGSAQVDIGGVNIGHVDEEGVKGPLTNTIVEALSGKFGLSPLRKWLNGQRLMIEFNLIQTEMVNLENILPGATRVSDGPNSKLTFGQIGGTEIPGVSLKLRPVITTQTPGFDLTIPAAAPIGDFDLLYSGAAFQKWACKFEALIDEAGGSDNNFLAQFGDSSITQDVVLPTVTTVVPNNNAVGVLVGSNVVWTMSEDLDLNTVNGNSVHLIEDPVGAATEVAGVVSAINAGPATTITFTPTGDLSAATKFLAMLEGSIKDKAGNNLAFFASDFDTA